MTVAAEAVLAVIAEESGLALDDLRPDATLEQLDIGSIDVASALFAIEDQFGVVVDPDELRPDSTISEVIALVLKLSSS